SGWNLGGPMIKPEQAPKKLVWSEVMVKGPKKFDKTLPHPAHKPELYGDLFVLAYPVKPLKIGKNLLSELDASSAQGDFQPEKAFDNDAKTFWVSSSGGIGPSKDMPEWLQFDFKEPVSINEVVIQPRPKYGPREGEVQVSDDGFEFRTVKAFTGKATEPITVKFKPVRGKSFRIAVFNAFDPLEPDWPRNVQIAEVKFKGAEQSSLAATPAHRPLKNWEQKAMLRGLSFSAPDTSPLLEEYPSEPNEEDTKAADVIDLTGKFDKNTGVLNWDVPAGNWEILRFGYTLNDHCHVSTCSEGWEGYALDPIDADVFQSYWNQVVEPLISDAGPLAGKTLKYLTTDSWEIEVLNWSPTLREEFKKRRGYDLLPYLPVIAGRIVQDRQSSNRFLFDLRKTVGELVIDNHFRLFREGAHKHGLLIHPESGGPHAVPIDAQRCLGYDDVPMSEFWAWSWRHRVGEKNRFFVKQPASAAHTYDHNFVAAEGFTTIGPHWQSTLWDNLKPSFDYAACEGLNLLFWHAFVCSPKEMGIPGQQYFAGTHLNPNVTWWAESAPFFAFINRCQYML
ncbi:MAG: glycosyl hydrolase, partial [Thermoguttaceae bacterium]